MTLKKWLVCLLSLVLTLQIILPVTPVMAVVSEPNVVLVGNLQTLLGAASDWDTSSAATQMTLVPGTTWYSLKGMLPTGSYEYKVAVGGSWAENYGEYHYTNATYFNGSNYHMTLDEPTEVLFLYDSQSHNIKVLGENLINTPTQVNIAGAMNNWALDTPMLYLGNGYYAKEFFLTAGTYEYKEVLNNNWNMSVGKENGGNKSITLTSDSNVLFVFDQLAMTDTVYIQDNSPTTATLVGNLQTQLGAPGNWNPAATETGMHYYGNGLYYLEGNLPIGDYLYKVAMNGAFSEAYYSNDIGLNVTASQKVAFLFNYNSKTVTDSVSPSLTLAGTFQTAFGESGNWNANSALTQMTQNNGLMTYVGDAIKDTYEGKFVANANWDKSYGNNGDNLTFEATNGNEFFFARELLFSPSESFYYGFISSPTAIESPVLNDDGTLTFNVKKDDPGLTSDDLYMIGSFNGWNTATQIKLTDTGKGYLSTTVDFKDYGITNGAVEYKFKYQNTWDGSFADSLNPNQSNGNSLVVVGTVADTISYHLTGSFQGWSAGSEDYKMSDVDGDGIYTLTLPLSGGTYEYKVTKKQKGKKTWIPDGTGNNHIARVISASDVTFYFNANLYETGANMNPVACSLDMKLFQPILKNGITHETYGTMTDANFDGTYEYQFSDLAAGDYTFEIADADGNLYATDMMPYKVTLNEAFNLELTYQSGSDYLLDNYAPTIDGLLDQSKIIHNSWDSEFRTPFGAVVQNTPVTLRLDTKKDDASKVTLIMDGRPYKMVEESNNTSDRYGITVNLPTIGVHTYYFIIQDGDTRVYYGGTTGTGQATSTVGSAYSLTVYDASYQTPDWMKLSITYQIFGDRFNNGNTANDTIKSFGMGHIPLQFPNWENYTDFEDTRYKQVNPDNYAALKDEKGWDADYHNEVYGGDLAGVAEKLDYLQSIGVKTIYFNPIFESISAHKYDSADYSQVDPRFGSNTDFEVLAQQAKLRGMNIILDGVFNHVGSDSLYFNKYGKNYTDNVLGAYEAWILQGVVDKNPDAQTLYAELLKGNSGDSFREDSFYAPYLDGTLPISSPYSSWFAIKSDGTYEGWWGYDSLPVIQSLNGSELNVESFADYIIENDDSIARQWIEMGSSGWRLDVSPEVSMDFWKQLRSYIKGDNKGDIKWPNGEPIILAENWGDATNDFLSGAFDSTMNYRFREAAIEFVIDEPTSSKYNDTGLAAEENWIPSDAAMVNQELMTYLEKYPKESSYALMNLLGSHDVPRILNVLGYLEVDRPLYPATINDIVADLGLTLGNANIITLDDFVTLGLTDQTTLETYVNERNQTARDRFMLASMLQMTYPGSPTIYYGDEVGMSGYHDPDNRKNFNWSLANPENQVLDFIAKLAKIRNENLVLKTGDFVPLSAETDSDIYVYGRSITGNTDALGNSEYITNFATNETISVAQNNGHAIIALNKNSTLEKTITLSLDKLDLPAGYRFKDALTGQRYTISNNQLTITLQPQKGVILLPNPKRIPTETGISTPPTLPPTEKPTPVDIEVIEEATPEALLTFIDLFNFNWAKDAISRLLGKGIIKGRTTNNFAPSAPIKRSEFAVMMARLVDDNTITINNPFTDVKSTDWYFKNILEVVSAGLFDGNTGSMFRPENNITREEATLVISRLLNQEGIVITQPVPQLPFIDSSTISPWALNGVVLCYQEGLINGNSQNMFLPDKNLTRAEAAVLLDALLQKTNK